jgi:hypothetical protein
MGQRIDVLTSHVEDIRDEYVSDDDMEVVVSDMKRSIDALDKGILRRHPDVIGLTVTVRFSFVFATSCL